ncbi:MAG: hypothetical protein ABWX67_10685 [Allosphingosinicella sp.]
MQNQGFWNDATILERQQLEADRQTPLITPFDPKRVQPASYRLSVGSEIYISSPAKDGKYPAREQLKSGEARAIPPGQFAFLITQETVHMPRDAIGFITLRLKPTKFKGIVNVSGFHVDPSFEGKLVFTVFNAGPIPVQVACGDQWFEIFFCYLNDEYKGDDKPGWESIPSEILVPGPLITMETLKDDVESRLRKVERDNSVLRWAITLILTFMVAFGVKSCSTPSPADSRAGNYAAEEI